MIRVPQSVGGEIDATPKGADSSKGGPVPVDGYGSVVIRRGRSVRTTTRPPGETTDGQKRLDAVTCYGERISDGEGIDASNSEKISKSTAALTPF